MKPSIDTGLVKKVGIIIGLILVIAFVWPFAVIDAGERGVVTRLGAYSRTLDPGFHVVVPAIERVTTFEVRTQKEQTEASAASKDLQTVNATVAVNYNIDPTRVSELYVNIGTDYKARVIDPAIQEVAKAVTAKYTAEELLTKRALVTEEIQTQLSTRLASSDIEVSAVSIVNFNFSPTFNAAIEAKVTAEQNALAEENNLQAAQFQAQSIRVKSEAANNEKYIQLQRLEVERAAVDKWNGVLPTQMIPGATLPFINLTK
jgi:regulator of protease activity HflC (stomatin/prohibitin superfamily)